MVSISMIPPQHSLDPGEMQRRALRIRLVLTDVDGTLTDGGVFYSEAGEVMKRFDLRDGMGVERLLELGVETAFITRESSTLVQRRADKLGVALYARVNDKNAALPAILVRSALSNDEVAYIGDDVNDLPIIHTVSLTGITAAPADAQPDVRRSVHYICSRPGGHGAFREFVDLLVSLKNRQGETR